MSNYERNRTSKDCSAVVNIIARANREQMEVEKKMCDALNELFAEELKEADEHGRRSKLKEMVQKKLAKSQSPEKIAEDLMEDIEVIKEIMKELETEER